MNVAPVVQAPRGARTEPAGRGAGHARPMRRGCVATDLRTRYDSRRDAPVARLRPAATRRSWHRGTAHPVAGQPAPRRGAVGWRLAAALCLLVALAGCRGAPADTIEAPAPQPGVDVVAATVRLALDPDALSIAATADLTVRHPSGLTPLRLGLDGALTVSSVRVDGQAVRFSRDGDALLVPVGGDTLSTVEIAYSGTPTEGLYASDAAGQRVVFTDGWPDRTAGWLPTVHAPADPFTLDLTVDVPAALDLALSGEPVSDTVVAGRRVVRSRLASSAPAYTMAFAAGHFVTTLDATGSVPVRTVLLAADADRAPGFRRIPALLDTLAAMLGPYPYAAFQTVEVPIAYAGMENAASPFLRAALYRETAEGRDPIEEVALHELVHQWWGNAVPPADWRDLWLAEGPATYLIAEALGRVGGPDLRMRHLARIVRETPLGAARRRLVPEALARPEDALSLTAYNKGAATLHVLRLAVGERAFWQTLRSIQAERRPLSTARFQAELERASGRSLSAVFAYWARGTEIPRLETRWDRAARTLSWTLSGDGGTLAGLPVELLVRQGDAERLVRLAAGRVVMPGAARPDVWPVGVLLDVE